MPYYRIVIRRKTSGSWRVIDRHEVPVGSWKDIGYWLDDCGYIEADTRVEITVNGD